MLLFNRQASIIIGQEGPSGTLIDGLRISFNITKSLDSAKNDAQISIYNLSAETRAKTEDPNADAIFKTGYEETQEIIFVGNIVRSITSRNGPDLITVLDLSDGHKALAETYISESFAAGTTVDQVIGKLARSFGLPIKELPDSVGEAFASGLSIVGPAKAALEDLAKSYDFDFSVLDGEVQLLPTASVAKDEAVLLTPDTGLVGAPEKTAGDNKVLPSSTTAVFTGVKAVSLLNPKLRPGAETRIESRFITGNFKVEKVTHAGDTHGPGWYSTIEGKSI